MGVNLWGDPPSPSYGVAGSPLYVNPVNVLNILTEILGDGKGGTARDRPEVWGLEGLGSGGSGDGPSQYIELFTE